jgi:hypothetical protein
VAHRALAFFEDGGISASMKLVAQVLATKLWFVCYCPLVPYQHVLLFCDLNQASPVVSSATFFTCFVMPQVVLATSAAAAAAAGMQATPIRATAAG